MLGYAVGTGTQIVGGWGASRVLVTLSPVGQSASSSMATVTWN